MQNDIVWQVRNNQRDKAKGVKHTPLHTLQECCEAAGITPSWFGRYAAKDPNAPQLVLHHAKVAWRAGKKYYRKHEFVQWVNQVRKQKEKEMPDIKTALEKAFSQTANAWAADDEAHQSIAPTQTTTPKETTMTTTTTTHKNVTTNVTRTTFDYIRDNAGVTRTDATVALEHAGFNAGSVTSLIGQMLKNRLIRNENGGLYPNQKEYTPLKTLKPSFKHKVKRAYTPRKQVPVTAAGLPALAVERPVSFIPALGASFEWSVDSVLDKLSVKQAMAVYGELRKIFGE